MTERNIKSRIIHKHDVAENWSKALAFTPQQGEIIIYDKDATYNYERFKIGDGVTNVNDLPFAYEYVVLPSAQITHGDDLLSDILDMYILNIDYENLLAFDTSEIVIGATSTTSVLGQAILGQMVLA
jgi:hypothetical protein